MAVEAAVVEGSLSESPVEQLDRLRAALAEREEHLQEKERNAERCRLLLDDARRDAPPGEDSRVQRVVTGAAVLAAAGLSVGLAGLVTDPAWLTPMMEAWPITTVVVGALALVAGTGWAFQAAGRSLHPRFESPAVTPLRERLEYAEGAVRVARRQRDAVLGSLTHARGQLETDGGGLAVVDGGGELGLVEVVGDLGLVDSEGALSTPEG